MSATGKMTTRYRLGRKLGRGSFGLVYECIDEATDKIGAVKTMKTTAKGLPSLLELSILMTYRHPCLNSAAQIETQKGRTYIFQDKADSDLTEATKKQLPNFDKLKRWTFQLLQGLECLHQEGIIHCDFKPSNCLVFGDDARITDYTLSVRKILHDDTFNHSIGTCNYKPPEILLRQSWSDSVDIWSLGCSLYQIATDQLLIPSQCSKIPTTLAADKVHDLILTKNLSAIIQWRRDCGDEEAKNLYLPDKNFLPIGLCDHWQTLPGWYRDMVLEMTSFNPKKRPSTSVLLAKHFADYSTTPLSIITTPSAKLSSKTELMIKEMVQSIVKNVPEVISSLTKPLVALVLDLYRRTTTMSGNLDKEKLSHIEGCVWIACKLLTGESPDQQLLTPLHTLLIMEQRICRHLSYRLHISDAPYVSKLITFDRGLNER